MLCCGESVNEVGDVQDHTRFKKRNRCTDCGFLIIFFIFLVGLIFICSYAFAIGSPLRMIHGSDSFGNICGYHNSPIQGLQFSGLDMRRRPYLFHLNQHQPKGSVKICVRKCPKQLLTNMADVYGFYTKYNSSLCRYDFDFSNADALSNPYYLAHNRLRPSSPAYDSTYGMEHRGASNLNMDMNSGAKPQANETGLCPTLPVLKTKSLLYHCVPEIAITQGLAMGHSLYDFTSSYVPLKKIISDVMNAKEEMYIMAGVAIFASFVSAFVIHFVAALASWLILIIISVLLLIVSGLLWWAYFDFIYDWQTFKLHKVFLPEDNENESILLAIAIISTIVTIVIIYAAAILRQHVKFVVALFHETAKCIRSMPMLLIQPIWTLVSLLLFFYFWVLAMMALSNANNSGHENRLLQSNQSVNENEVLKATQLASFTLIRYKELNWIHYFWWYLLIALVWVSEFILSCQQVVIAGAVASWYFTRDRSQLNSPILGAIWDLFSRHLGSVALGSFLITLLKLPRLIIQQISSRLRQYPNSYVAKTILDGCSCCLYMVEKFLNYLNRNAYTVVVIDRVGFCPGAKIAFQALLSNAIRVAAINSIGDFILFLGKLAVSVLTAIVGIFLVRNNPSLHYWTVPVFLMTIFAFWIAHCLLSVYEMVIDAMFLCFCRDMNLSDGTPGNEYYSPPSLLKFLTEDQTEQNELRENNERIKANREEVEENPYATVA